jgi:uncharacterized Rmd1/YagE family protein
VLFPEENLLDDIPVPLPDEYETSVGPEPFEAAAGRTLPERLLKEQRRGLARVSSFCVAEQFKIERIIAYLRDYHVVLPKKYDECLYFYYEPVST